MIILLLKLINVLSIVFPVAVLPIPIWLMLIFSIGLFILSYFKPLGEPVPSIIEGLIWSVGLFFLFRDYDDLICLLGVLLLAFWLITTVLYLFAWHRIKATIHHDNKDDHKNTTDSINNSLDVSFSLISERAKMKMSQQDFANLLDVSIEDVKEWESGNHLFNIDELSSIFKKLDLKLYYRKNSEYRIVSRLKTIFKEKGLTIIISSLVFIAMILLIIFRSSVCAIFASDSIELIDISERVTPGNYAQIQIQGDIDATYRIDVYYNSTRRSRANGLFNKTADSNGFLVWKWKVARTVPPGIYDVIITNIDTLYSEKFDLRVGYY